MRQRTWKEGERRMWGLPDHRFYLVSLVKLVLMGLLVELTQYRQRVEMTLGLRYYFDFSVCVYQDLTVKWFENP